MARNVRIDQGAMYEMLCFKPGRRLRNFEIPSDIDIFHIEINTRKYKWLFLVILAFVWESPTKSNIFC